MTGANTTGQPADLSLQQTYGTLCVNLLEDIHRALSAIRIIHGYKKFLSALHSGTDGGLSCLTMMSMCFSVAQWDYIYTVTKHRAGQLLAAS